MSILNGHKVIILVDVIEMLELNRETLLEDMTEPEDIDEVGEYVLEEPVLDKPVLLDVELDDPVLDTYKQPKAFIEKRSF